MPNTTNPLTGKYHAVVQVRVETINRILAVLHGNGKSKDASPSFPHSLALRVDEVGAEIAQTIVSEFGSEASVIPGSWSTTGGVTRSLDMAPPGVSTTVSEMNRMLAELQDHLTTAVPLRGTAQIQVSTPGIAVPNGSTSGVIATMDLRAHYIPDPGTAPLPEPIHGTLMVLFHVQLKVRRNAAPALEATLTEQDSWIQFVPTAGTNLSVNEEKRLETEIRRLLRARLQPVWLELSADFPFRHFKGLGSGSSQVVALPVRLNPATHWPADGLNGLNQSFLGPHDEFTVAVSREYIDSQFAGVKSQLSGFEKTLFSIPYPKPVWYPPFWEIDYVDWTMKVTKVHDLKWSSGEIEFSLTGNISGPFIDDDFTVSQKFGIQLSGGALTMHRIGSPGITGLPSVVPQSEINNARSEIATAIDDILKNQQIALPAIDSELKDFDDSLSAAFKSAQITGDGLIINGSIVASVAAAPFVVEFHEQSDGKSFNALHSWIPGGTIERFDWSWVKTGISAIGLPWAVEAGSHSDEHRFVLRFDPERDDAPVATGVHQLCLTIVGQRYGSPGQLQASEGQGCNVSSGPSKFDIPLRWEEVNVPSWIPDPPDWLPMEDAIVAHVNALADNRPAQRPGTNTIVHFADDKWQKPLDGLGEALRQTKNRNAPTTVVLILPPGSFRERRSAFEERLGSLGEDFTGVIEVTEDYEGKWKRLFGVKQTPATHLVNARREHVWQQQGRLDPTPFQAALDEYLIPGFQPRSRLMRLTVRPGDTASDVLLEYGRGKRAGLKRLRGRRVLLLFWKSWSAPCMKELQRLQRLHEAAGEHSTAILAVNDGEPLRRVNEMRGEHEFPFPLIPDPHRRVSERYGVQCWPTTVEISEDGLVDRIHFGMTHDSSSTAGNDQRHAMPCEADPVAREEAGDRPDD